MRQGAAAQAEGNWAAAAAAANSESAAGTCPAAAARRTARGRVAHSRCWAVGRCAGSGVLEECRPKRARLLRTPSSLSHTAESSCHEHTNVRQSRQCPGSKAQGSVANCGKMSKGLGSGGGRNGKGGLPRWVLLPLMIRLRARAALSCVCDHGRCQSNRWCLPTRAGFSRRRWARSGGDEGAVVAQSSSVPSLLRLKRE